MAIRIVACDDEPHITRAVKMKLTKAGFDVETYPDGQAAWEAIQRKIPALVVTDYQMPRMDGLELIRTIRSNDATRELPIILLTAKGFELNEDDFKVQLGVTGIMVKPFSPRELLRMIQETLGVTERV